VFASAGADKTISLWDMRAGLLLKTFYGHLNAVNHIDFSLDVIPNFFLQIIYHREINYVHVTPTVL
jgi:WD40 repeat protein